MKTSFSPETQTLLDDTESLMGLLAMEFFLSKPSVAKNLLPEKVVWARKMVGLGKTILVCATQETLSRQAVIITILVPLRRKAGISTDEAQGLTDIGKKLRELLSARTSPLKIVKRSSRHARSRRYQPRR